jgi:hypothetical protein
MGGNCGRFVIGEERIVRIEGFMCDILKCESAIISVLRAVARRRLLETENPSACATMCYK